MNLGKIQLQSVTESELMALAEQFSQEITAPAVVYLEGKLGAGKTTFVRAFLRALGYSKTVKSPTYGIVETYELNGVIVHHFDLYRLNRPDELEEIGIEEYFDDAICLIEWPEKGKGYLPKPDYVIQFEYVDDTHRSINICRSAF